MKAKKITFSKLPENYEKLCELLPPRPIHNNSNFRQVAQITDAMAGHDLNTDQQDYFDLLCRLIEDWEQPGISGPTASGLETLQALLEAQRMTAADLSKLL